MAAAPAAARSAVAPCRTRWIVARTSPRAPTAYFDRTREVVARFGDKRVTYAVFLRRPVICAPRLMADWLAAVAAARESPIRGRA